MGELDRRLSQWPPIAPDRFGLGMIGIPQGGLLE
jgi:hypothetical protein